MLFNIQLIKKTINETLPFNKTAEQILLKEANEFSSNKTYDIFLSHSYSDAQIIYGIKKALENLKHTVYVDWVDDPQTDRNNVTHETANLLKTRMITCKSLFFVVTESSPNSKWMPWELGYFDGIKNKVAILPIKENYETNHYQGQEYLGLYPYVTQDPELLWIHYSVYKYDTFRRWLVNGFD